MNCTLAVMPQESITSHAVECSVCGKPADGTVTANGQTDGWCDRHAAAVMAAAILTEPATPPSVEILDVDSYRSGGWSAA